MDYVIGIIGILLLGGFFILYQIRPIHSTEEDDEEYDEENDENSEMCLTSELDDEIGEISRSLDEYLLKRCLDRARYLGRKTADVSDLNCIMFELEFDNKILSEIK